MYSNIVRYKRLFIESYVYDEQTYPQSLEKYIR